MLILTDAGRSLSEPFFATWRELCSPGGQAPEFCPSVEWGSSWLPFNATPPAPLQNIGPQIFDAVRDIYWIEQVGVGNVRREPRLLVERLLQVAANSWERTINVLEEDITLCQRIPSHKAADAVEQLRFITALLDRLFLHVSEGHEAMGILEVTGPPPQMEDEDSARRKRLHADYERLLTRLSLLQKRCEMTSGVLFSTMGVLESQKSIEQAEQVNELTKLAFFYIPLSFVAAIFGMNVHELEDNPPIWMFFATALPVAALSVLAVSWLDRRGRPMTFLESRHSQ